MDNINTESRTQVFKLEPDFFHQVRWFWKWGSQIRLIITLVPLKLCICPRAPHPYATEILEVGLSKWFNKPSRWHWCILQFEYHFTKLYPTSWWINPMRWLSCFCTSKISQLIRKHCCITWKQFTEIDLYLVYDLILSLFKLMDLNKSVAVWKQFLFDIEMPFSW